MPLLRDGTPEKREEHLAALGDVIPPVVFAQHFRSYPGTAIRLVDQHLVGASKNLLPAQPIGNNQHHVPRF
jgi:hypothetical protein